VKKLLQKVGGYGRAVFGGATNVVDGADFSEDRCTSGGDGFCSDGFADERLFGGGESGGVLADACGADAYVLDVAAVYEGENGNGYFGDGLSVACANLPDIGFVTF